MKRNPPQDMMNLMQNFAMLTTTIAVMADVIKSILSDIAILFVMGCVFFLISLGFSYTSRDYYLLVFVLGFASALGVVFFLARKRESIIHKKMDVQEFDPTRPLPKDRIPGASGPGDDEIH